jgi:hypothetical protein
MLRVLALESQNRLAWNSARELLAMGNIRGKRDVGGALPRGLKAGESKGPKTGHSAHVKPGAKDIRHGEENRRTERKNSDSPCA